MESPAQVAKGKGVRKTRPPPAKTSFNNPYSIGWKPLDGESIAFILEKLKLSFQQTGLCKVEPTLRPRKPRRCRGSKDQEKRNMEGDIKEDQQKAEEVKEETGDHMMNRIPESKQGWTNVELRKQLAIGINEVTRALEKHTLCLALVCKSVKPLMTQHLIQLSVSREVPACQVPRLSETVAPVLGLKSILALGFKKNAEAFIETVNAITSQVPPLNVSWLPQSKVIENADRLETKEQDSIHEMPKPDLVNIVFPPSQKRKFDEVASSDFPFKLGSAKSKKVGVTLLPLKIKKVIPNPNKIRKPKKNKKINKHGGNLKQKSKLN
ncbi:ribonuclease P protein subunit p38 [Scyliorhinus canicula]|uniref:ribonuclease P protein subunit p38 n=1 Tax=Scyliorhinus canicula TaxID=7830 RepID=UPI0018F562CF|nr:ribonuclease P protein subunit p38 [Scyliorhinus canicula]XP_038653892.1 ribonuclease P protein subunit p38 [Scyliorhinus canicula]XP_038653893.1 ribonuclease P protein subunit p38 [Scyliorhinus canicula]